MPVFVVLVSTVYGSVYIAVLNLSAMLCLYDALCSITCTVLRGRCQSSICAAKQIMPLLYLLFKTSSH